MATRLFDKKYWTLAKEMKKKHPYVFTALEEYDRTKKLPKSRWKKRVDFTIDAEVFNKFRAYCEEKNLKMSNVIENLVKKQLARKA